MVKRKKSNPERLTTLLHLVKLGAVRSFANISTERLGRSLELSQQAASLRLADLERAGLVERAHSGHGLAVRLTDGGLGVVDSFLADAGVNLERGKNELIFRGNVFTGLGEGGDYVSVEGYARGFSSALGFEPYSGTLNLRLTSEAMIEQRRRLDLMKGIEVPGFSDGRRSFGPVKCFKAKIAGKQPGAVLAINGARYDSTTIEAISPVNLRKSLGVKDGDEVSIIVYLGEGWARRR
jgi:riboflavin kinase